MHTTDEVSPAVQSVRALDRTLHERLLAGIQGPRGVWIVVAVALLLTLPALGFGLNTDDHVQAHEVRRGATPLSLFAITPEAVAPARERGALAWWSSPKLEVKFFRPLASLTHIIEYNACPHATWFMHL